LCQCPRVVFPSCFSLVKQVLSTMVTKTMELHVLPHLKSIAIVFINFDF
jgi:hypothetical protein